MAGSCPAGRGPANTYGATTGRRPALAIPGPILYVSPASRRPLGRPPGADRIAAVAQW